MFLVIGEFHERFGNGAEEKIVHNFPVRRYQVIQFRGNGEDRMEILDGKKIFTTSMPPDVRMSFLDYEAWLAALSRGLMTWARFKLPLHFLDASFYPFIDVIYYHQ